MKNNTYRVFAFSESSIKQYLESNKAPFIDLTKYPDFDTIVLFFIDSDLALNFLKNGKSVYGYSFVFGQYPTFHFPIELAGTIQSEQKEESLFRVGDRVYDWSYGWCKITGFTNISIFFELEKNNKVKEISIDSALKQFSFTEYNFIDGGLSQERLKPSPKVGDIGWFWDNKYDLENKSCFYGELKNIEDSYMDLNYYIEDRWFKYFSTEKPF